MSMMINYEQLKKVTEKPWFYPVILLLIGLIAYGYVLTSLGYYWADWEIVMFTKLNPALQFRFYAHDRPFPWTYHLIYGLVGSNPLGWHIITLLIRWAGTLFFVRALSLLWPRYKNHFLWLGVLLLLYPGFLQQSQSATKARHIMTLLLFTLSLYFMALAVKRPKWARFLFPLSWLATFTHLFTTEYFAGIELIRPLLLWVLVGGGIKWDRRYLRETLIKYLPYLAITVFYFWCRFFYFPLIFHTTSRLSDMNSALGGFKESWFETAVGLLSRALSDLIYLTVQVWTNAILNFPGFMFTNKVAWFVFGLGILVAGVFAFFHDTREEEVPDHSNSSSSPAFIFIVGLIAFVLGALPIWAIGRQISAGGWNDRFALAPMLGACLMVVAFLIWFVRPSGQKLILSFLVIFSVAVQAWVVNNYRQDWRTQLSYYWQLYWRAPALQPGTALFTLEQPSPSVTHYSDSGFALNILYHYQTEDGSLPYWLFLRRYHFDYQPEDAIEYDLRGLMFTGNTSEGVSVLHQMKGACLRVLDTVYADDPLYTEGQDILIAVSNPAARIIDDPTAPPPDPDIFGPEPARNWCYYFQKADLARQQKDWDTAIALLKQAQQNNLTPGYGAEYIPFVEAYAQTGDWQKAYDLTLAAQRVNSGLKKMFCNNWARLSKLPAADAKVTEQVKQSLACTNY